MTWDQHTRSCRQRLCHCSVSSALARVVVCAALCALAATVTATAADKPDPVIAIKAARVYTLAGDPLDNAIVLIRDGRIAAVGRDVAVPADARVYEIRDAVLTPGLIDACCTLDFEIAETARAWTYGQPEASLWKNLAAHAAREHGGPEHICGPGCGEPPEAPTAVIDGLAAGGAPDVSWADQAAEVTPHRLVLDSVNFFSNDFGRLAEGGITTVYVSPDSANVLGSRGAILRTGGPLRERVIRRADAVKASLGDDPSRRGHNNLLPPYYGPAPSLHTRRPTTRMGVDFVFRKAFYDAQRVRAGQKVYGADTPPAEAIPVLQQVLDGQVPLRIQARLQNDIFSALRLAQEFKLKFALEEATEAYRCLPQLAAAGVPVIFGPLYDTPQGYRATTDEVSQPRLNTPKQLADAGIEFALTAQELRDEDGLVRQGMLAVRFGLTPAQALRAMTATPAKLLGLSEELGAIKPGLRADVVLWSGAPLDATSRPLLVLSGGRIVYDGR